MNLRSTNLDFGEINILGSSQSNPARRHSTYNLQYVCVCGEGGGTGVGDEDFTGAGDELNSGIHT